MENKKIIAVLISCFLISSIIAQKDNRLKGIEKELNEILELTKAAGFAVAIVEGDKIIYSKGFGYRDYEKKIAVDANTLFAIGSCSKAFTSSILGQLRNEEKLSFDDSPIKYVPELKFYNKGLNNNVIIKDLMCHRTGIPRHDWSWYFFPTMDKDSLLQRIEFHEPFTGLREKWYYNNFMFLVQGVIAEHLTNKSWEDNIKERFFKPLGMDRSNVSITEMKNSKNAAFGYELKKDSIISKMDYYHLAGMSPAGSINSSVNDMSNWMITWLNNGKFKGQEILPESYLSEAISSQMVVNSRLPKDETPNVHLGNYGYAWAISSYKGHYSVGHGGNIDGFSANVTLFPTDSIGVVILANQGGSAIPGLVRDIIADRMLKTKKTDWIGQHRERLEKAKTKKKEKKDEVSSSKIQNTKQGHISQDYTGKYSHPGYGQFNITLENDSLFVNFTLIKFYLRHYHYDVFEPFEVTKEGIDTSDTGPLRFNFTTNDVGEVSLVKFKAERALDHAIEFKHTPTTIEVNKETLERYVGEFDTDGIVVKVYIKNEKTLYLFVSGQPEYGLLATGKHKFSFKTLEGFKVEFTEEEDKSINTMTLIQPNGTFKATRKK